MGKVVLIIIYNHQYNKNITVLEDIYAKKFSKIFHLVPFYTGEVENVIPVYENSFYFQGFVAQGLKSYFKEEVEHYLFIGDDLILNPFINEHNYTTFFKLKKQTCFIPDLVSLDKTKSFWHRVRDAFKYNIKTQGVEAERQLPNYEDAIVQFLKHGLEIKPLHFDQINPKFTFPGWSKPLQVIRFSYNIFKRLRHNKTLYHLSYPLTASYSDIFIINTESLKEFCHYCGVFAATNLFVEVAVPTAMVLSSNAIITENKLDLKGKTLWSENDFKFLDKYNYKLSELLSDFPSGVLYLHPIKLSKWQ